MAKEKPREPNFPGDGLTPLQAEALHFIHHCQEELSAIGIYIRSSEMLEFATVNKKNEAAHDAIAIPGFTEALQAQMPLYFPNDKEHRPVRAPQSSVQYELTISDPVDVHQLENPLFYKPETVPVGMNHAKIAGIRKALLETTSLTKPDKAVLGSFKSLPFSEADYDWAPQITSALQVKFNPVDKDGVNLFSKVPELRDACAESLLHIQDKAGLAFLPFQESLERIGSNLGTPGKLGIAQVQAGDDLTFSRNVSTIVQVAKGEKSRQDKNAKFRNDTQIENRLAGADADPFIVMALTLAACMKPLRAYASHKLKDKPFKHHGDMEIPEKHGALVKKFEDARDVEAMLGKHFYHAILKEYGKGASR